MVWEQSPPQAQASSKNQPLLGLGENSNYKQPLNPIILSLKNLTFLFQKRVIVQEGAGRNAQTPSPYGSGCIWEGTGGRVKVPWFVWILYQRRTMWLSDKLPMWDPQIEFFNFRSDWVVPPISPNFKYVYIYSFFPKFCNYHVLVGLKICMLRLTKGMVQPTYVVHDSCSGCHYEWYIQHKMIFVWSAAKCWINGLVKGFDKIRITTKISNN